MIFHGHTAIGLAHLIVGGIGADAQYLIGRQHRGRHITGLHIVVGRALIGGALVVEVHLGTLEEAFCKPANKQSAHSSHYGMGEGKAYDGKRPLEAAQSHPAQ